MAVESPANLVRYCLSIMTGEREFIRISKDGWQTTTTDLSEANKWSTPADAILACEKSPRTYRIPHAWVQLVRIRPDGLLEDAGTIESLMESVP